MMTTIATDKCHPLQPLVLLGPGRSGTTLLYKLLCMHPAAAFISNYDVRPIARQFAGLAIACVPDDAGLRRRAWFTPDGRANLTRRPLWWRVIPTPVEGEAVYRACGLQLGETHQPADERTRARLRARFQQIQSRRNARVLVLKRTANNRRLPALASALPEAKYVLIWRDGRAVARSLLKVNWWMDHPVWWAGGRTPRQLAFDTQTMVELAAKNWIREVECIERGLRSIDPARVMTIRFEDLIRRPREIIERVARFGGLEPTAEYLSEVQQARILRRDGAKSSGHPDLSGAEHLLEPALRKLSYLEP